MPKSYRIRTQVGVDKYINVELDQDFEFLEILSLKLLSEDVYTRFCSDYGVVVGRVLVNNGFGVPNARVSVFIPLEEQDQLNPIIAELYPYQDLSSRNEEGYRYNLLPKDPSYIGHQATGTYPTRGNALMDQSYIEVYDKYYKFSVKTNESGDFMIFGVPLGEQTIVMDVDLSDIGCFSLSPQDLIQQGVATEDQVDGASFKTSTNLDSLPQIVNLNFNVDVRPLWGDLDVCQVGITRVDFDLTKLANIKIEPSAVFMGSIVSTTNDDALKISCKPKNNTGNLCELIAGEGQIISIRQTVNTDDDGYPILEQYNLENDGKIIDGDGSFLTNLPMNLDYVVTNEFGEQIISNDPTKGIPTKGKYRFKFKWVNKEQNLTLSDVQKKIDEQLNKVKGEVGIKEQDYSGNFQRAHFLVPNIKEYGWSTYDKDPLEKKKPTTFSYQISANNNIGPTQIIGPSVLQFVSAPNTSSYIIYLNGQQYFGDPNIISLPGVTSFYIDGTAIDPNQTQDFTYTEYPEELYYLFASYAFSLDWNDYGNTQMVQEAIDCEDRFYEFNYNKVYTTAMFLDRYKNGIGRAKHLGIKEIDDRSCASTNNTFPVNDIIRNFDPIFFVFNIFTNILIYPLLTLLYVTHFVAFIWPILKWVLLFLGIRWTVNSIQDSAVAIDTAAEAVNDLLSLVSFTLAGPVIDPGLTPELIKDTLAAVRDAAYAIASVASAVVFTAFITNAIFDFTTGTFRRLRIPRLGFPMITYNDCTTCECECNTAELDDDVTPQSIQDEIDQQIANSGAGSSLELATPNSFLAPVNSPGSYNISHPNLNQNPIDSNDPDDGYFSCGGLINDFQSFSYTLQQQDIEPEVVVRANFDFLRIFSGYDIINSTEPIKLTTQEKYLLHAPQPFLWSAGKTSGINRRWFAFPTTVTYPQKLNDFNTRDKYFANAGTGIGPNRVKINVNNSPNSFYDQVIVVLANPGTSAYLGTGQLFSFQDPALSNSFVNLTGASFNQFQTNSITGVTFTGQTTINVGYGNFNNINATSNLFAQVVITGQTETSIPSSVAGVPGVYGYEENYLKYPTDIEYFQVITGMTVGTFLSMSNNTTPGLFPNEYLLHRIKYVTPECGILPGYGGSEYNIRTTSPALQYMAGYQNYELVIMIRGVDPHTQRQNISYDLSRIFGNTSFGSNQNLIVSGDYFINVPIQSYPTTPRKPKSHVTGNNQGHNLYFNSYSFQVSGPTATNPNFTAFTSTLPYYYIATDDSLYVGYSPAPFFTSNSNFLASNTNPLVFPGTNRLPYYQFSINPPQPTTTGAGGGAYLASNNSLNLIGITSTNNPFYYLAQNQDDYYLNSPPNANFNRLYGLYSPAYYRNTSLTPVNFINRNRIVMRSDRIPTSTRVENGLEGNTGYGLHQNNNFTYYNANGEQAPEIIQAGFDTIDGSQADLDPITSGLTETLQCETMVSLQCYSGSGTNIGIIPADLCPMPPDRVVNGCYCLLNKGDEVAQKRWYLIGDAFKYDSALLLEWKVRFTLNFAACRGVFSQTFQNNWVNGVLYMFSFNTRKLFGLDPNNPNYTSRKFYKSYCDDVIVYNDITNNFYYRSSPWNETDQEFIGKESPNTSGFIPALLNFPGAAYNVKQIQFPTTVVDLGPRDLFINEICANPAFGSYYANQMTPTSYQDNSDLLQLSFLSRILNENFRQNMEPGVLNNNVREGVGITQFFDNDRKGQRIDGDIAQMMSINSEWKVTPFISENLAGLPNANSYIYFNNQGGNNNPNKPVFGVFFSSTTQEFRYRRIMSPGIETFNQSPLIQQSFGYPKAQFVPNYKWYISTGSSIFGNENNNWYTDSVNSQLGFFQKKYQDVDFDTPFEKYRTSTTKFGFISNFTAGSPQQPNPSPNNVLQGVPSSVVTPMSIVVVGAPYHFYFGLVNGNTAVDKFYKLYVADY